MAGSIGLIAAMSQEIRPVLAHVGKWRRIRRAGFPVYQFRVVDENCILILSGIGGTRASRAAAALLEQERIRMLVSFGIAGAAESDLQIGDVVIAASSCTWDGSRASTPRTLAVPSPGTRNAIAEALVPYAAALYGGTAITTRGSQYVPTGSPPLTHPVLEMETAAVLQCAMDHDIPLYALRSISDNPQEPIPINLETWYDPGGNLVIGEAIRTIVSQPRLLKQLQRVSRNARSAEKTLAVALLAMLQHMASA